MCAVEVGPTPAADKEPAPVGEVDDDNGGMPDASADVGRPRRRPRVWVRGGISRAGGNQVRRRGRHHACRGQRAGASCRGQRRHERRARPVGRPRRLQMLVDTAVAADQVATTCAVGVPAVDNEPAPVGEVDDDNGGMPDASADLRRPRRRPRVWLRGGGSRVGGDQVRRRGQRHAGGEQGACARRRGRQ